MYKIEKNIPFGKKQPKDKKLKYPFAQMVNGDSFFVEGDSKKITSVRTSLNYFKMGAKTKYIYKTRVVANGVRVWCLSKDKE